MPGSNRTVNWLLGWTSFCVVYGFAFGALVALVYLLTSPFGALFGTVEICLRKLVVYLLAAAVGLLASLSVQGLSMGMSPGGKDDEEYLSGWASEFGNFLIVLVVVIPVWVASLMRDQWLYPAQHWTIGLVLVNLESFLIDCNVLDQSRSNPVPLGNQ